MNNCYFSVLDPSLWIGTISACFQAYGSDPVVSDLFSNMLNKGAISSAFFQTRGGRWSGPGDLYTFRFFRICEISISLQTRVNNSEPTTLLKTEKLVKDSDVNTEGRTNSCFQYSIVIMIFRVRVSRVSSVDGIAETRIKFNVHPCILIKLYCFELHSLEPNFVITTYLLQTSNKSNFSSIFSEK